MRFDLTPEEWIHRYAQVLGPPAKRLRGRYVAMWRCPFHDDRNPSFGITRDGWYKCFACGENGGWLDFTRKMGVDLAAEPKISPVEQRKREKVYQDTKSGKNSRNGADFAHSWCLALERAEQDERRFRLWHAYRGLSEESVRYWRLGVGVLPGQRDTRLILPVFEGGELVALKGRRIGDGAGPKWIQARGGKMAVFGADHVREVADGHVLIVCESPVDAILVMQEWPDVLAIAPSSGATAGHDLIASLIADIKEKLAGVVVAFDNDLAGTPNAVAQWQGLWAVAERAENEEMMAWLGQVGIRDDVLERYMKVSEKRGWPRVQEPNGPALAAAITKAVRGSGLPVTTWRWPEDAEVKEDVASWILKGREVA